MNLVQIELGPTAPVVLALDRTMSMSRRDCPEGASRWEYALSALREAMLELCSSERRVALMTFGRDVQVIENARPEHLDTLTMGDGACCTGQAAAEALYFARPAGALIIISDGLPDSDSRIGQALLSQPDMMQALFTRTCFMTVGKVDEHLRRFAELWPNHCSLEDAIAATADTVPPPPEVEPELSVVGVNASGKVVAHGRKSSKRR